MEGSFWKTLLVLAVCGTPSSLAHRPLSYGEALELADPNSEGSQQLNFTLKETACQVEEERSLEECGFQEDGDQPRRAKRFLRVFKKLKKVMGNLFRKKKLVLGSVVS
ncbi:hypothetical protein Chor_010766 [Crotalus horridus]